MRALLIACAFLGSTAVNSQAQFDSDAAFASQCVELYKNALRERDSLDEQGLTIRTMSRHTCSGSNRNLSAGFDSQTKAIVQGVPVVGRSIANLGISNNKQFCDAMDRGDFNFTLSERRSDRPVVEALEQATKCMEFARKGDIVLTHDARPGRIAFYGKLQRADVRTRISANYDGGFSCVSPKTGSLFGGTDKVGESEIVRENVDIVIYCERIGKTEADGSIWFGDGSVTLSIGGLGNYTVSVSEDKVLGKALLSTYQKQLEDLNITLSNANKEKEKLKNRSVTVARWHFGAQNKGSKFGTHFGCSSWSNVPRTTWLEQVRRRACPSGQLIDVSRYWQHRGDACGYNYFSGICDIVPE